MVGYIGQQRELAMTTCMSALAYARSAWRRRGMSRDPSHEQGIAGAVDVKAGVKDELPNHYKGFLDRYVKYADELPPCSGPESERDDSPAAMFRRMDGAAVGSGAAAGAAAPVSDKVEHLNKLLAEQKSAPAPHTKEKTGVVTDEELTAQHANGAVLPDGDPCSSSLHHRPPAALNNRRTVPTAPWLLSAASTGEPCSLSTTRVLVSRGNEYWWQYSQEHGSPVLAVSDVPHRTGGSQGAAVAREVPLPAEGRETRRVAVSKVTATVTATGLVAVTSLRVRERLPGEQHYSVPGSDVAPCALEAKRLETRALEAAKRREKRGRLKLKAAGRQQSMRQAAAIAAARGRAMDADIDGGRCGSPQVFVRAADMFGMMAEEIRGSGVREAVRGQAGGETVALWPEVHARAQVLAPQILRELTDAARHQPSRSPSPLNSRSPSPLDGPELRCGQIPPAGAHGLTVASIEQKIDREHSADELDWAVTQEKRAESSGAQPELPALPETTTGGCVKDMQIKIAQFPWPRSFSGRLLGGAVQLGRSPGYNKL